jgi:hypothetical protein
LTGWRRRQVPRLGPVKRNVLRVRAPLILGQMAQLMLRPSGQIVARFGIPGPVLRQAYASDHHRARTAAAVAKVRALCVELGIATPRTAPLWRAFGLWPGS